MNDIKTLAVTLLSGMLAFLHPIGDFMRAAVILLALNYFFGLTADLVHRKKWSFHKSMVFFKHAFLFFGLAFFIFTIGHYMHNEGGAVQCVSYLCYAATYFFGTNILRNLLELCERDSTMGEMLGFVYYAVSLQFMERIPLLKDYLKKRKEKK